MGSEVNKSKSSCLNIEKVDIEGTPINVCTKYEPHTISLVKTPALGINILKAKGLEAAEKEELIILKDKIEKAKKLDRELDEKSFENLVEKSKSEEEDPKVEVEGENKEDAVESKDVAAEPEEDPVVEPEVEVGEPIADPVEKSKSDDVEVNVEEKSEIDSEADKEVEVEESEKGISKENEGVEKSKTFSLEELGNSTKLAIDSVSNIAKTIMSQHPDSDIWEVIDLVHSAIYKVEDALYDAKYTAEDEIFKEVWAEVEGRTEKSKALKVEESDNLSTAMKSFQLLNPEMAVILQEQLSTSAAKALEAEKEKEAIIRQKALALGVDKFKRIATDDNSTDQIVDALASIQVLDAEAHTSISKALDTASSIMMAGQLFNDVGSADELQHMSAADYVDAKSKALVEASGKEGTGANLASARAEVRQSADYVAIYK